MTTAGELHSFKAGSHGSKAAQESLFHHQSKGEKEPRSQEEAEAEKGSRDAAEVYGHVASSHSPNNACWTIPH